MKKSIIFIIIGLIIIISIIAGFVVMNNNIITITLDINPSIEIKMDKNENIKSVRALNEDAKAIVNFDYENKTFDEVLDKITENVIDKGYVKEDVLIILFSGAKNNFGEGLRNKVIDSFHEKNVETDVVMIDNITREDERLANKYNITPSKASYINSIVKENKNIEIEKIVERPITELKEIERTGDYCDNGYSLRGNLCVKKIDEQEPKYGNVCSKDYYEYNGKCYKETPYLETDNLVCRDEFTMKNNKCSRTITRNAEPSKFSCEKGELKERSDFELTGDDIEGIYNKICVDYSKATHPVSPCEANDGTEYTVAGGVCYWHRAPVIEAGCPGKSYVNGECWDNATGIYICPGYRDGKRYTNKDEYCTYSLIFTNPSVTEYKCENGYKLNGTKCEKDEIEDAQRERVCADGYTMVEADHCINMNDKKDKEKGYYCDMDNSELENNKCIIYEFKDAIHS